MPSFSCFGPSSELAENGHFPAVSLSRHNSFGFRPEQFINDDMICEEPTTGYSPTGAMYFESLKASGHWPNDSLERASFSFADSC